MNRFMTRLLSAVAALVVVVAAGGAFWAWYAQPVALVDVPGGRLACLSYTPYDGNSSPLDGKDFHADSAVIRADLEAVSKVTNCIRTYSALEPAASAVPIAAELGLTVWQGLWIGAKDAENEAEIAAAVALAKAYPDTIERFVVGNEVLLRRELLGEELAAILRRVKAAVPSVAVTYADVPEFWRRNPVLAEAADIVTIHILPYWDDPLPTTMDEVQAHARALVTEMQGLYPERPVAIGEIGWPNAGRTRGGIIPTLVNEARFVREFVAQADAIGVAYNIVEAIDQDWKIAPEGTVGGHWGILDHDRKEKFPLIGPVSEWAAWPAALLLSSLGAGTAVLAGLLAGFPAGFSGRAPQALWRWLVLAAWGQTAGTVAVFGVRFVNDVSFGWWAWTLNSTMLALGLVCLGALVPVLTGAPFAAGQALVRPASLRTVALWLRRPWQQPFTSEIGLGLVFGCVGLWTAQLAVLHAFDGRHRDFPLVIVLPVAVGQALRWWRDRDSGVVPGERREEGWLAMVMIVCGALAWNGPDNIEAMVWMATLALFAVPGLGEARLAMRRLLR